MSNASAYRLATISIAFIFGCSGSGGSTPSETAGSSSNGGSLTGGTVNGGANAMGGTVPKGGTSSSGGGAATGGALHTGGAASAGGSNSTGGTPATGGVKAAGGSPMTGGALATGGAIPTGGTNATGGQSSAGGTVSTGGSKMTGGTNATGGSKAATGGTPNAGGASTGGAHTGGANTSTGGTSQSGSCPTPALKSGDSTKTITVGGLSREYILHVPSAYTGGSSVPLVLDFHPLGGSDTSWRTGSPYPAVIDKEGVISAFPNGEPGPSGQAWNVEGCCVSKINGADVDDVAFAKAIVTDIEKVACIDPKRVYAVGFSMGGGMSNYLACHAADVFAATGPASFDLTQQNVGGCTPTRPVTVVEWRGKNDTLVPYAGGHSAVVSGMAIDFLGAVATFQKWASLDGCTGNPGAADSNNCQTYSQCSAGVQVTLCTDNNGGHEAANANIVWPMLKKYALP